MTKDSLPKQPSLKSSQRVKKPSAKQIEVYSKAYSKPPTNQSLPAKQPPVTNPSPTTQKSPVNGWLGSFGVFSALIVTGTLLIGGGWLAALLMIDPNTVVWLNRFLPEWGRIRITASLPPKTFAAIQDEIRKNGLIPAEALPLNNSELLLPIFDSEPNCQSNCEKLVELRVYQPAGLNTQEKSYQLVSELPISGPKEYFAISASVSQKSTDKALSRSLPLTKLTRFDKNAPTENSFWFNLSGQRLSGDTPITYGQIVHYNPEKTHLSIMLQWTSPAQVQPYWQQVTGSETPELVVNQTLGLEPRFRVYQLKPRNFIPDPIYLEEISLEQTIFDTDSYRNALLLMRSGLWSGALQTLQSQKKNKWSAEAQAQLDVVQMHAQITQSQAKQAWATQGQQIYANLIDGRWEDALLVFQALDFGLPIQEIVALLKADVGGLWTRIETANQVNPENNYAKSWAALLLTIQQGRPKAIAYLKQLEKTQPVNFTQINELLDYLEAGLADNSSNSEHLSQIVGTAQQVQNISAADWLAIEDGKVQENRKLTTNNKKTTTNNPILQKEPQQVWYQIQVTAFNDGKRWRQTPFANLKLPKAFMIKQLWKYLGLDNYPQIQVTVWTADGRPESRSLIVKALSFREGVIQLLAAGEALPPSAQGLGAASNRRPLAYTDAALRWLEPGSVSFSELNNIQPQWVATMLPALWQELQKSGQFKSGTMPSLQAMLSEIGHWSVRVVALTGNNQSDAVLTLYEDLSGALKKPDIKPPVDNSKLYKSRSLIFSAQGNLLYSEFSQDKSRAMIAIADLGDGGPPGLVINDSNTYSFQRWSNERKRFD
jgi:hypothetical protein